MRRIVRQLALELGAKVWEVELAAALSQIGFGPDAESPLQKRLAGEPLSPREIAAYRAGPERTAGLLERAPRLESLAAIVQYQDAPAWPERLFGGASQRPPFGARILKVALDFDELLLRREFADAAFEELQSRGALYDSSVTAALRVKLPQLAPAASGEAA